MKKIIVFSLLLSLFFLTIPLVVLAQNLPIKDSAVTVVGTGILTEPGEPPPGEEPPPGDQPPSTFICSTDPTTCLRRDFNVVAEGDLEQKREMYNTLAIPGRSGKYLTLLKESGGPDGIITIKQIVDDSGCHARVNNGTISLFNFFDDCGLATRRWMLMHETGHVIDGSHGRLLQSFKDGAYYPNDSSCYGVKNGSHFLKTYPYNSPQSGNNGKSESFAESVSTYVLYSNHPISSALKDYPTQCRTGYGWVGDNIYGGTTF